jgi:hypothetical protein
MKACKYCGKDFSHILKRVKYCSRPCYWKSMKGRKLSQATIEKLRKYLIGRKCSKRTAKKIGDAQRGEKNHMWRGGRSFDKYGYVLIKSPCHPFASSKGYVYEHRLVMESVLGRYLKPKECVHHKDKNRQNNIPSNLERFDNNAQHLQKAHKEYKNG